MHKGGSLVKCICLSNVEIPIADEVYECVLANLKQEYFNIIEAGENCFIISKDAHYKYICEILNSIFELALQKYNELIPHDNSAAWACCVNVMQLDIYTRDIYMKANDYMHATVALINLLYKTCTYANELLGETRK